MVFKNLIKLSLAGGAVYWTAQQGIWGTAQDGAVAGRKLAGYVYPPSNDYVEKLTSAADVNEAVVKNWNAGVKAVFGVVSKVPDLGLEYAGKARKALSDLTKEE